MKLQGVSTTRLKRAYLKDGGETFQGMDLDMLEAHPTYFHYEPTDDHCFSFVCLNQFEWRFHPLQLIEF